MKRALGERCHYYILNILSDNWQNDGFRQLKAEMAYTPIRRNRREGDVCTQIKALPFQSGHENVKVLQWQRNLPKSVLYFQSFCFAYFVVPVVVIVALRSLVGLPRKNILDMHRFSRKTKDFVENGRPKSTSTSTQVQKLKFIFRSP